LKIFGIDSKNETTRNVKVKTCVPRIKPLYNLDGMGMSTDHTYKNPI